MGGLETLISAVVEFPEKGVFIPFISKFVYILLSAVYNGGAIGYGLAIIFFTLVLRLILVPLDFANRYFTRKNSKAMEKFKPEIDAVKEQYAGDPIAINKATREVYRKNGHKMGGFCAFSIINLVLTLIIFMTVFYSLRSVADYNVNAQYVNHLQPVYQEYEAKGLFDTNAATVMPDYEEQKNQFTVDIRKAYSNSRVGFLWVTNIWKQDTWVSKTYDWTGFYNATNKVEGSIVPPPKKKGKPLAYFPYDGITKSEWNELGAEARVELHNDYIERTKTQYNTIFGEITPTQKGWNGMLFLLILAGVVTYFSAVINMKLMQSGKKKEDAKPKETQAQYSMRNVKNQGDKPNKPVVDPAMMGKIMKFVLPIIMVWFAMISTAALAIYIIFSSLFATLITMGMRYPVNWLLDWQEKRAAAKRGEDPTTDPDQQPVINPHAKYFKKKLRK